MPAVVVDTHTVVWFLSRDPRLSAKARDVLRSTTAAGGIINIPSICLVELTYLVACPGDTYSSIRASL
jgi:PIN domain nuclease of toxin-antitoxin system